MGRGRLASSCNDRETGNPRWFDPAMRCRREVVEEPATPKRKPRRRSGYAVESTESRSSPSELFPCCQLLRRRRRTGACRWATSTGSHPDRHGGLPPRATICCRGSWVTATAPLPVALLGFFIATGTIPENVGRRRVQSGRQARRRDGQRCGRVEVPATTGSASCSATATARSRPPTLPNGLSDDLAIATGDLTAMESSIW